MIRPTTLAGALTVSLAASAHAQTTRAKAFREGTPVVIVGMVSSQPRDVGVTYERKMQVAIGPEETDYTLHFEDARLIGLRGQEISGNDFRDRMWVRAEGFVMDDPRRIEVTRLEVIGNNLPDLQGTQFHRRGFERGYVMATGRPLREERFREGTPVVVVGQVTSPPKGAINEKKMQVGVGPQQTEYTLHFRNARLTGPYGENIDEDGLDDGMWVRAEGVVMDDPKRIEVARVQVIGEDTPALRRSAFYRPGFGSGYVMAVAGSRETYSDTSDRRFSAGPMVIVGRVSDDTGALETTRRLQVEAAGNEWTLHVDKDSPVVDAKGEKISVHEIKEGQWVRATGWQMDDLRMRVARIENIGAEELFRRSTFYREQAPLGYVERTAGDRSELRPIGLRGRIVSVNREERSMVVRDDQGREFRLYGEGISEWFNGDPALLEPGTRITFQGPPPPF